MERNFRRHLTALDSVFKFVNECMDHYRIADQNIFAFNFIIEELFTNMVKYSRPPEGDIIVKIERNNNECVIVMWEDDVDMFDITKIPDADVTKPIEDREPGGLGIHLVRRMVNKLDYDYANRQGKVTIIKNLEY